MAPRVRANRQARCNPDRTNIDPSVLFEVKDPDSHTSCMPMVSTEVTVRGNITDEQLDTIKRLVRYSPVHGMVEYANQTETKIVRA